MARIAVLYDTGEGQTATISEHVAGTIANPGHEAVVADVDVPAEGLEAYDGAIVGSCIHMGNPDTTRDFVYTDWDDVRRFTEDFVGGLAQRGE